MQPVRHSEHGMSLTEQVNRPPASVEAEQALLGGLMLDNHSWDIIAGRVSEADFYRPDHRLIFDSIKTLSSRDKPRDAITVSEYLESRGVLGEVGGLDDGGHPAFAWCRGRSRQRKVWCAALDFERLYSAQRASQDIDCHLYRGLGHVQRR